MREFSGYVYLVGAGPGDPDLITVRGRKIIEEADTIIYAGSLVNEEVVVYEEVTLLEDLSV